MLLTSAVGRRIAIQQVDNLACGLSVANQLVAHDILLLLNSALATTARTSTNALSVDEVVPAVPNSN